MRDLLQEIMLNRSQFLKCTGFWESHPCKFDSYGEESNAYEGEDD